MTPGAQAALAPAGGEGGVGSGANIDRQFLGSAHLGTVAVALVGGADAGAIEVVLYPVDYSGVHAELLHEGGGGAAEVVRSEARLDPGEVE
jgi:hypothetical protein